MAIKEYQTKKGRRYQAQLWHGTKQVATKAGFTTKADARRWVTREREEIERTRAVQSLPCYIPTDLDLLREQFKVMAADSSYTLGDIFNASMEVLMLPYRFKDVLSMVKNREGTHRIPPKIRVKIIARDNSTCQLCGAMAPGVPIEIDHIIPRSRGGLTEEKNLRVLCRDCNVGKSDTRLARMRKN